LTLLVAAAGCARKAPEEIVASPGQTFNIYKDDRKILTVKNEPGPLLSTAILPPGTPPPKHPFLSGSALYAPEEGNLREILEQSAGFDDFLKRLKARGYRVEPAS